MSIWIVISGLLNMNFALSQEGGPNQPEALFEKP
jgi:hypothetical protein